MLRLIRRTYLDNAVPWAANHCFRILWHSFAARLPMNITVLTDLRDVPIGERLLCKHLQRYRSANPIDLTGMQHT
jgi:hypothetical protein